uniref:ATP synthase complex subunit 8 n=1 Tax=Odorrana hainanensis TaxID=431935 RepID=A0A1X9IFE4_ODOHA|nr:ATP synthase F0 subunit 8 [Odorrana hainanensis]AOW70449.1 ATPase subunit 8 [Odorrana hainanensis]
MPQLDPVPWFCYFIMTWLILTSLAPQKILLHINPGKFNIKKMKTLNRQTWTWTWQ